MQENNSFGTEQTDQLMQPVGVPLEPRLHHSAGTSLTSVPFSILHKVKHALLAMIDNT